MPFKPDLSTVRITKSLGQHQVECNPDNNNEAGYEIFLTFCSHHQINTSRSNTGVYVYGEDALCKLVDAGASFTGSSAYVSNEARR